MEPLEWKRDNPKILLLEGDSDLRRCITLTLKPLGMEVLEASDPKIARQILEYESPDLFVADLNQTAGTSGELIEAYRNKVGKSRGAVLLTTIDRPDDQWRNVYAPDAVVYKPFDIRFLYRRIMAFL